jgi:hypothetical protein
MPESDSGASGPVRETENGATAPLSPDEIIHNAIRSDCPVVRANGCDGCLIVPDQSALKLYLRGLDGELFAVEVPIDVAGGLLGSLANARLSSCRKVCLRQPLRP